MKSRTEQQQHAGQMTTWLRWMCPGCQRSHSVPVSSSGTEPGHWQWNGSVDCPTIHPSVRHFISREHTGKGDQTLCHYHIQNGMILYCDDCEHQYNGQTMLLPDVDVFDVDIVDVVNDDNTSG